MRYSYKTKGVCSSRINFEISGDKVTNVEFVGGCNGNLKALGKLVEGFSVEKIQQLLEGNTCGFKNTSCADQLAKAVKEAYDSANK